MHGVLQGFGQDSIPHSEKTSYARKIGKYLPGTFDFNAVSRLKKTKKNKTESKTVDCCIFKLPTLFYCNVIDEKKSKKEHMETIMLIFF